MTQDNIYIRPAYAADIPALLQLEADCFPTISPAERIQREHFQAHQRVFPEGQLVAVDRNSKNGSTVIAVTSTFRCSYPSLHHTFLEATGDMFLTTHQPEGEWLYGFDMAVSPQFQGRGIARLLYRARQKLCTTFGLKGQVIVGLPNGLGAQPHQETIEDYVKKLTDGLMFDPTVSVQMRMGFKVAGIIPNHVNDPRCRNYGILMELSADQEI